jgi:transcriptional regulator with XRE-family HTH domain
MTLPVALRAITHRCAGLTQGQLGDLLGTDATFVSRVERGTRGLRWHTLARFLRALDADLHQLADAIEQRDDPERPGK